MRSWQRALVWSAAVALLGAVLVVLYPDSYQQDGGQHYLFARWAFDFPVYFVKVWARPVGVLSLPDGSLLFSEESNGRLYRVTYKK